MNLTNKVLPVFKRNPLKLAAVSSLLASGASIAGEIIVDMDYRYEMPDGSLIPISQGMMLEEGGTIIVTTSAAANAPTELRGNCDITIDLSIQTGFPYESEELIGSDGLDYRLSKAQLVLNAAGRDDGGLIVDTETFEIEVLEDGEVESDEYFVLYADDAQTTCVEYYDSAYGDAYYRVVVPEATFAYGDLLYVEVTDSVVVAEPPGEPENPEEPLPPAVVPSREFNNLSKQINTATTITLESANTRNKNIARELARMRQTEGGISTDHLSVTLQGQSVSLRTLGQGAGDATSGAAWGAFLSGNIEIADAKSDEVGFDFDTSLLTGGVDVRLGSWVLGSALTLVDGQAEDKNNVTQTDLSQWGLSLFSSYFSEHYYLNVIASNSQIDYDFEQTVSGTRSTGDSEGTEWNYALGGGYQQNLDRLNLRLFFIYDASVVEIDSFEYVGENVQLVTNEYSMDANHLEVGFYINYTLSLSFGVLQPFVELSHNNLKRDTKEAFFATYTAGSSTGELMQQAGLNDSDYAAIQVGVSAVFPGGVSGYLAYDTDINRDDWQTAQYDLGLRWEF